MNKDNNGRSARKHLRNLVSFALGLCVIAALFFYLNQNSLITNKLSHISLIKIMFFCLAGFLVSTLSMSVTQQFMSNSLNCDLGFFESLALTVMTRSGNTLTPFRLGTMYRASYLKRKHNLSFIQFGSMFLSLQLILFLTGGLVTCIALTLLSFEYPEIDSNVIIVIFIIFILCSSLLFRPVHTAMPIKWIDDKIYLFIQGWQALQQDKMSLWITISGRIVSLLSYTIIFQVVLHELGEETGWLVCLFFSSVSSLTMLVQLIPGSLGITESVITYTAVLLSLPSSIGFSAALLIRLSNIFYLILFVLPCWLFLKRLEKT